MMAGIKLSIITVNLNNVDGLSKTIQSVAAQTARPFEYFIIDGGSEDGSVEAIQRYAETITRWVSEKDGGLYEAMNKGLHMASGDYCLFLNSGDWLLRDDVLENLISEVNGEFDVYYSDHFASDGSKKWLNFLPTSVDINYFTYLTIAHPNSVTRRDLLLKVGGFNEHFKISSDWLFFLDAITNHNATFRHIATNIACFDTSGASGAPGVSDIIDREKQEGIKQVFGNLAPPVLELNRYRNSVYGSIVRSGNDGPLLTMLLKLYRRVVSIFRRGRS